MGSPPGVILQGNGVVIFELLSTKGIDICLYHYFCQNIILYLFLAYALCSNVSGCIGEGWDEQEKNRIMDGLLGKFPGAPSSIKSGVLSSSAELVSCSLPLLWPLFHASMIYLLLNQTWSLCSVGYLWWDLSRHSWALFSQFQAFTRHLARGDRGPSNYKGVLTSHQGHKLMGSLNTMQMLLSICNLGREKKLTRVNIINIMFSRPCQAVIVNTYLSLLLRIHVFLLRVFIGGQIDLFKSRKKRLFTLDHD